MAKSISILLADENLRYELGKAARDTIKRNYTWDSVVKLFIKYL